MNTQTKKWTKEEVRFKLETNNKWLYRGLMVIYNNQTADEKQSELTAHDNGVGFNGCDANYLSRCARFLIKNGHLGTQLDRVRRVMLKYASQLTKISNKEILPQ